MALIFKASVEQEHKENYARKQQSSSSSSCGQNSTQTSAKRHVVSFLAAAAFLSAARVFVWPHVRVVGFGSHWFRFDAVRFWSVSVLINFPPTKKTKQQKRDRKDP